MAEFEFTAFIENLNSRTRNFISGAHLTFPTTTEMVQATLNIIGVDGLRNEEVIVTDYTINIPGLRSVLGEYASIDELNYLAHRINDMSPDERAKFVSAIKHGEYANGVAEIINLTYNLDCYDLIPEVTTYEEYGQYLAENRADLQLSKEAAMYFDYAAFGEDSSINDGGELTAQGYIYNNGNTFRDVYDGKTVPAEYRVFKYPMQARAQQKKPPKTPKPQIR